MSNQKILATNLTLDTVEINKMYPNTFRQHKSMITEILKLRAEFNSRTLKKIIITAKVAENRFIQKNGEKFGYYEGDTTKVVVICKELGFYESVRVNGIINKEEMINAAKLIFNKEVIKKIRQEQEEKFLTLDQLNYEIDSKFYKELENA